MAFTFPQPPSWALSAALIAVALVLPANAQVINYTNGQNNTAPIQLTNNTTQLQTLSGVTAAQSGVISQDASSRPLEKIGSGTLIFTGFNTYTGTTTISGGALQVGDGVTAGALSGNIVDNGSLVFAYPARNLDHTSYTGIISGSGSVIYAGTCEAPACTPQNTFANEITGANTYTGGTFVNSGILQILGTLGSSAGATTVSSGTLQIVTSTPITQNGGVTLVSGNLFVGTLSSSGVFALQSGVVTSTLAGTGSVNKTTSGTVTLYSPNTYTGGTTVSAGTLVIGNNAANVCFPTSPPGCTGFLPPVIFGTLGSTAGATTISGGTLDLGGTTQTQDGGLALSGGTLQNGVFSSSGTFALQSGTVSAALAGTGAVVKTTSGLVTLTAANTYTGTTTVSAGTLTVTGSLAGPVTVSGGQLGGTGTVGTTSVASGATLAPGASAAPGTLTVSGNLTLASGSNFTDAVMPSAAGLASVSGTASINGSANASFAPGGYASGQQFILVKAAGGLSGTFSSFAGTGLPASFRASLSYDANDVYLNLKAIALAPSLAGNTTTNQRNVVAAIDAAVLAGAVPGGGFNALYGLSGASLNGAIDQISGQIGPNVSNAVGQSFLSFLALTAEGGLAMPAVTHPAPPMARPRRRIARNSMPARRGSGAGSMGAMSDCRPMPQAARPLSPPAISVWSAALIFS